MKRSGRTATLTLRAVALGVAVLFSTGLGAWRAVSMAEARPDPSTLVVNGVSYTVTHAEQVKGLSDSDLGGMAHGIQSLVPDGKALVRVTLVVSAGDAPVAFDATVLRAFATGSPAGVAPVGGTLSPGRLSANGRMEGSLSFVFPRNGAHIVLRGPDDSRQVALLQVDHAAAATHQHHDPTASAKMPTPRAKTPSNRR